MKFAKGFKADAELQAEEVWAEAGAKWIHPLDPFAYARDFMDVPVWRLSDVAKKGIVAARTFCRRDAKLSAYSIVGPGLKRLIVVNDAHHVHRQRSSLCHELAHALLQHPSAPPLTEDGFRNFDSEIEAEAGFLGFALMLPKSMTRLAAQYDLSDSQIGEHFGSSEQLATYRMGITAARRIRQLTLAKYRS